MRITNELPRTAAPYPVKRVDRLVKLLNQWADRWIGAENGLIGFYEKDLVSNHLYYLVVEISFGVICKFLIFETPNSPKSFKFDCTRSREHSSEISCFVTRTCLQMKMNCQKKFNDEETAARVMMTMQNLALFLR